MGNYTRRGRQARNFTTNVLKILDLESASKQIFSENCRRVPLVFVSSCNPPPQEIKKRMWFECEQPFVLLGGTFCDATKWLWGRLTLPLALCFDHYFYLEINLVYLTSLIAGLRLSVLVTSSMLLAGKLVQLIPLSSIKAKTIFIYIGHLITMLPSFIANGAPPLVSNTWFPPDERTTATAIGALAANFGAALAFFIGPAMIPNTFNSTENSAKNFSKKHIHLLETRIMDYFYVQVGLAAFLFLCVVIYFPSKPPLPPSIAALTRKTTEIGYKDGLKMLIYNKSYWLLVLVFAASFGIYFGWTSVLDLAVQPFSISEKSSGWLGTCSSLAGIISGVIIAR